MAGNQSAKQAARREQRAKVASKVAARVKEIADREKRIGEAAIDVVTALMERDEAVAEAEAKAGAAIQRMLDDQVPLSDIATYCDGIDTKELSRLLRQAQGQEG